MTNKKGNAGLKDFWYKKTAARCLPAVLLLFFLQAFRLFRLHIHFRVLLLILKLTNLFSGFGVLRTYAFGFASDYVGLW